MKINDLNSLHKATLETLRLKAEIEALKKQREALKNDMIAFLKKQTLTSVTIAGNRVSYMPYSVTRFDSKRFEEEHAKLYAKYVKTDWFTKLTVTPKKEKATEKKAVSARSTTHGSQWDSSSKAAPTRKSNAKRRRGVPQ